VPDQSKRRPGRLDRVNHAVQEVVADELELIGDERLALATVTGVRVDPDMRHAKVWFSALDPVGNRPGVRSDDAVASILGEHRVRLQKAIGRQLRLKRTPELTFRPDPAIAAGSRVEDILRGLQTGPIQTGSDQTGEDRGRVDG
jgi:ribosome-binding factor A